MEVQEYTGVIETNLGEFSGIRAIVSGGSLYVYVDDTSRPKVAYPSVGDLVTEETKFITRPARDNEEGLYPIVGMVIRNPSFTKRSALWISSRCKGAFSDALRR